MMSGLDMEALGIVSGKFCWVVYVDILVLQVLLQQEYVGPMKGINHILNKGTAYAVDSRISCTVW